MVTMDEIERLLFSGGAVVGDDGRKIGNVGEVFLDASSGQPAWVTVKTGLLGTSESFVPLDGAQVRGQEIHVPFGKDTVKHAPHMETAGGHLSVHEERDLYRYYGLRDEPDEAVGRHPDPESPAPGPDPELSAPLPDPEPSAPLPDPESPAPGPDPAPRDDTDQRAAAPAAARHGRHVREDPAPGVGAIAGTTDPDLEGTNRRDPAVDPDGSKHDVGTRRP